MLDRTIEIGPLLKWGKNKEKGDKDEKELFCILQVEKMIKIFSWSCKLWGLYKSWYVIPCQFGNLATFHCQQVMFEINIWPSQEMETKETEEQENQRIVN